MTKILLKSYKKEYETTDISVENLCLKYDLNIEDLRGCEEWAKDSEPIDILTEPIEAEVITTISAEVEENQDIIVPTIVGSDITPSNPSDSTEVTSTQKKILKDLETFKLGAVKECLRFIKNDARYAEVKEFKDMVAIADSIEKSYKDVQDPAGHTINILIQNLNQRFKEVPDDC